MAPKRRSSSSGCCGEEDSGSASKVTTAQDCKSNNAIEIGSSAEVEMMALVPLPPPPPPQQRKRRTTTAAAAAAAILIDSQDQLPGTDNHDEDHELGRQIEEDEEPLSKRRKTTRTTRRSSSADSSPSASASASPSAPRLRKRIPRQKRKKSSTNAGDLDDSDEEDENQSAKSKKKKKKKKKTKKNSKRAVSPKKKTTTTTSTSTSSPTKSLPDWMERIKKKQPVIATATAPTTQQQRPSSDIVVDLTSSLDISPAPPSSSGTLPKMNEGQLLHDLTSPNATKDLNFEASPHAPPSATPSPAPEAAMTESPKKETGKETPQEHHPPKIVQFASITNPDEDATQIDDITPPPTLSEPKTLRLSTISNQESIPFTTASNANGKYALSSQNSVELPGFLVVTVKAMHLTQDKVHTFLVVLNRGLASTVEQLKGAIIATSRKCLWKPMTVARNEQHPIGLESYMAIYYKGVECDDDSKTLADLGMRPDKDTVHVLVQEPEENLPRDISQCGQETQHEFEDILRMQRQHEMSRAVKQEAPAHSSPVPSSGDDNQITLRIRGVELTFRIPTTSTSPDKKC